ncbi:GGDEF domain-containing protein [Roseateles oligotrophus]|uniref:GGDEF domain-containing protein n=1 Tax=Roseateles oligotrophus TaxID=1769250 RepID=A0ABT2YAX7_9BURK|nr:GGDEF domain-containing protein [Roseateles oligotrophus]MCV2367215.1 GGDEF domain-containing protein [Roseateles oligotrophus]
MTTITSLPPGRTQERPAPLRVQTLIAEDLLTTLFQPIVQLDCGLIYGHEALVRGPAGSALEYPDALFAAGRREGLTVELEVRCANQALKDWSRQKLGGRLLINMSASALTHALRDEQGSGGLFSDEAYGVSPSSVMIELTEHERVTDIENLRRAITALRRQGVGIALDDFGDGRSSLRLWSEIQPDIVKIDKYFTHDLPAHAEKLQTFRALLQLAETFGAQLIAEGIESAEELRVLRDLGVTFGQGWLIGRPSSEGAVEALAAARTVLASSDIAVLPELRRASSNGVTAERLMMEAVTVREDASHEQLFRIFNEHEQLHAIAILNAKDEPVALVDRSQFINRWAKPFFNDLYGRHACTLFANQTPLIVDADTGIEALTTVLTSSDQRYLREGFIITRDGRYLGLGTGEQLVRSVTEARIEAARHANPLTFLPGNIPISQHIGRLLTSGRGFVAAYADLNHFKPFNDEYGYWRGDEMIRLVARVASSHCDSQRDFLGHVGGDDFVMLFQSDDWEQRCEQIVERFNDLARNLFDAAALQAGGIMAEDRHGDMRFHPCTTLSIGAVRIAAGTLHRPEQVATAAATAKRHAKHEQLSVYVMAA